MGFVGKALLGRCMPGYVPIYTLHGLDFENFEWIEVSSVNTE